MKLFDSFHDCSSFFSTEYHAWLVSPPVQIWPLKESRTELNTFPNQVRTSLNLVSALLYHPRCVKVQSSKRILLSSFFEFYQRKVRSYLKGLFAPVLGRDEISWGDNPQRLELQYCPNHSLKRRINVAWRSWPGLPGELHFLAFCFQRNKLQQKGFKQS